MGKDTVVNASDVVELFKYALKNDYGYIYGRAGELWTQAKQEAMNKTTAEKYAMARKYGKKWIGHYVADCSGLFHWAYGKLGSYMYHGSNTMYNSYCSAKGQLKAGKRTDGQALKPGTAVFVYKASEKKYTHVGLYIGDGYVIEAASTQSGVIKSKANNSKWTNWGELIHTRYGDAPKPEPVPKGYAEVTGKKVALRKDPCDKANIIMRIDTGEQVKVETPPASDWQYVAYKGKTGYMMKKFLDIG